MSQFVIVNKTSSTLHAPDGVSYKPGATTPAETLTQDTVNSLRAAGFTVTQVGAVITGQAKIAATDVPQALPNIPLSRGLALVSKAANNAAGIGVGGNSGITKAFDGTTGTALIIEPGRATPETLNVSNANQVYIVGTIGDIVSYVGY